ncbi:exopolysaccharide biosynthesis polyprenyl glycosylphosphotransferase [Deinococcus sp. S9]|uniref:exopolysaccharide biosynthesis polyprenyl glycosylphosphotransferase n=1 Tax=Deinococcus sp. S9 TaxID=2545754 RepID=UPI0010545DCF|nr:exopolysaccharide biosynthesis polyprenyl glycosylphosphotransferase [Deinococcus sp. S9]TDE86183.1 exopolysaccharide biosynthesis polyprenyl glycosylphosphotransferase [Deinococcus sp. S9]
MQASSDRLRSLTATRDAARLFRNRRLLNALVLVLGDVLALGLAFTCVAWWQHARLDPSHASAWVWFALVTWVGGAFFLQLLPSWGLGAPTELKRITELTVFVFASTTVALYFTRAAGPGRVSLVLGVLLAWPLVLLLRNIAKKGLVRARLWGVPTVVYGGAATGRLLIAALQENPGYGYIPVGVFDDNPRLHGTRIGEVPVRGFTSEGLAEAPIAVLAMPGIGRQRTLELLEGPLSLYRTVVIIPDLFEMESLWVKAGDFGGLLGLEVTRNLLDPVARAVKRAFDLVAVLLSAPLWLPLCLLVALAIWLEDRTNPLFLQRRVGLNGLPFTTWKFRTMLPNAEEVLRQTLARDAALRAEWEANYKLREDPRVTRVGAFLRKTSLDELPQLVNVLLGQMSLVGPRPLPPYHQAQLSAQVQRLRERVRPGMTGLWQVSGRSAAGNVGMERWDPYYVRNWSFWLDLVILIRTLRVVVRGSGAY